MKSLSNKERYKEIGVSMATGPSTIIKRMYIPWSTCESLQRGRFCLRWDSDLELRGREGMPS